MKVPVDLRTNDCVGIVSFLDFSHSTKYMIFHCFNLCFPDDRGMECLFISYLPSVCLSLNRYLLGLLAHF